MESIVGLFCQVDDSGMYQAEATLVVHHGTGKTTSSRESVKERNRLFVKKGIT